MDTGIQYDITHSHSLQNDSPNIMTEMPSKNNSKDSSFKLLTIAVARIYIKTIKKSNQDTQPKENHRNRYFTLAMFYLKNNKVSRQLEHSDDTK